MSKIFDIKSQQFYVVPQGLSALKWYFLNVVSLRVKLGLFPVNVLFLTINVLLQIRAVDLSF